MRTEQERQDLEWHIRIELKVDDLVSTIKGDRETGREGLVQKVERLERRFEFGLSAAAVLRWLAAALVGCAVTVASFWDNFKGWFHR